MLLMNVFIIVGIITSAISGALLGVKKHLDFFGIIVLGVMTALGGGILRDVLIGHIPPAALELPHYSVIAAIAALIVMFFPKKFSSRSNIIKIFDALGLGIFTAVGVSATIEKGYTATFIAVTIGVITGVGGGVIRDILAQEIPLIFKKEIYAIAALIGALSMVFARHFISGMIPLYICFLVTITIRLSAMYFGVHQRDKVHPIEDHTSFHN